MKNNIFIFLIQSFIFTIIYIYFFNINQIMHNKINLFKKNINYEKTIVNDLKIKLYKKKNNNIKYENLRKIKKEEIIKI